MVREMKSGAFIYQSVFAGYNIRGSSYLVTRLIALLGRLDSTY